MATCEKKIKVPTTGLFDFPELVLGGKGKYVDKTRMLYDLASDADQQLFISRPRRFGKSLMLSTLKAMFEGLTKLSIFSGLNYLKDRTMDPRFATLLGYTPGELDGAPPVFYVGVNYDPAKRGIDDPLVEPA